MSIVSIVSYNNGLTAVASEIELNKDRTKIIKYLKNKNIPISIFYQKIFSDSSLFNNINSTTYLISKDVSQRIFSIPMYPYITKKNQDKIIQAILDSI